MGPYGPAGAGVDYVLHQRQGQVCDPRVEYGLRVWWILVEYVSIRGPNRGHEPGIDLDTAVGECCVGAGHIRQNGVMGKFSSPGAPSREPTENPTSQAVR
jgi:hypothetical protein